MSDRWRVGRKVGRTVYRMVGTEPSDDDKLIGMMDTTELAQAVVDAYNFRQSVADGYLGGQNRMNSRKSPDE